MTENSDAFRFSLRPNRAHEINWIEWGEEAFRRSAEENKPILLSISAVWCHWCHVMDETSYSDGQVINLLNQNYIPVRVDSDRRPDINSRYNQGGWPSTVFLTTDGEIIAGTTFMREDQFVRLLTDVFELYRHQAADIDAAMQVIKNKRRQEPVAATGNVDQTLVDYVTDIASQGFDAENGGFGTEPKFPYTPVLNLLLSRLAADAPGDAAQILRLTLEKMATGGIFDAVAGGFFRYATKEDWSEPHYEKMLEDNAALLGVYCEAYNLSHDADYAKTAYGVHRYLTETLLMPETGAFAGSQDADEEYYRLDAEGRSARTAPFIDRTIYTGANCLAASALLRAFQVFGEDDFRQQALGVLGFVWDNLWSKEAGAYHYRNGDKPQNPGLLQDATRLALACLDAYESGAGEQWLDRSLEAATWMIEHLLDPDTGTLYDAARPPGPEGYPSEKTRPLPDNSVAATAFLRLGQGTGQSRFTRAAETILKQFAGSFQEHGLFAADFALAVSRMLEHPARITIAGPPEEPATTEMIKAAHKARIPFRSVEIIDPETYGEDLEESGYAYAGIPTAYMCIGSSCQAPVTDPMELSGRLENGWSAVGGPA